MRLKHEGAPDAEEDLSITPTFPSALRRKMPSACVGQLRERKALPGGAWAIGAFSGFFNCLDN
jgi:hypothetical protein